MNNVTIWIELDGTEFPIEFEYSYSHEPDILNRAPEDCSPEEEEFEYNVLTTIEGMNAIEAWEFMEIGEDVFFDAAMNDIIDMEDDYNPMWDNERDYIVDENLGC